MKVDGKALMLRVGGKTVALATSCALEETLETFDARTKDDEGAVDVPGAITGNLTTDSLLGMNEGPIQHTHATLSAAFREKQPVDVEVFLAANACDAVPAAGWANGPVKDKGFVGYAGRALIKSLRLTGDVEGKAKLSVQLGVQGELAPVTPSGLIAPDVNSQTLRLSGTAEVRRNTLYIESAASSVEGDTLYLNRPEPEPINL